MNEIEKAIEVLNSVKQQATCLNCDYFTKCNLSSCVDCYNLAIQALQEKAENDKLKAEDRIVVFPCAQRGAPLYIVNLENGRMSKAHTMGFRLIYKEDGEELSDHDWLPFPRIGKNFFFDKVEAEKVSKKVYEVWRVGRERLREQDNSCNRDEKKEQENEI